jgi:diguanylate cyclase (GGDEF)-like protein/PAS domain S-box-containing protein
MSDAIAKLVTSKDCEVKNLMLDNLKSGYEQLVANIPIGVYRFRTTPKEEMTFEYVNNQFCEMLSVSSEDLYEDSKFAFDTIHPEEIDRFHEINLEAMRTQKPFLWEGRFLVSGIVKWLRISSIPEPQPNGDIVWNGVQMDITERKEVEKALLDANALLENRLTEIEQLQTKLRDQAIRDYLTGLYNRRYLDETMLREIARSNRESRALSVVIMDIDHFKGINDVHGHQAGDDVLVAMGSMLKLGSRSSDIACRYGGDEFVVVMPNASAKDAFKRAEEWLRSFSKKRFSVNEMVFSTTLSIGVAAYPMHASSPRGLFQAADEALYHSKMYHDKVTVSRRINTGRLRSFE